MQEKIKHKGFNGLASYLMLGVFIFLTLAVTYLLYIQIQDLFKARLQERLKSMAATAAIHFDAKELSKIQGAKSVDTDVYRHIVLELNRIRSNNHDIKYIYILRKTNNDNIFEFVADADSLNPAAEIDLNGDGIIDDSDALNSPGDEYDVSEFTHLKEKGFLQVTVDEDLAIDQWGTFLSASAPIIGSDGKANELLGIDVEVSDFIRIINLALIPYVLFVCFLLLILVTLTVFLVNIWKSRVNVLEELDTQKDELLGIVVHQLAKPITALKWNLEMLMDGDVGTLQKEQLATMKSMQDMTANLSDLVSMILDVSRVQLDRLNLEPQELDLNNFFKEILSVVEPSIQEKNQNFIKDMPSRMPCVMLDKRYLRMTVENMLSNAVKYTPEKGTIELKVTTSGDKMYCHVRDTGCGIPKQDQDRIFGKLFRASNVRNTVDGNGFGLYVAKGAIEGQGGKMWFSSEDKVGTTFYFELPLKLATNRK